MNLSRWLETSLTLKSELPRVLGVSEVAQEKIENILGNALSCIEIADIGSAPVLMFNHFEIYSRTNKLIA